MVPKEGHRRPDQRSSCAPKSPSYLVIPWPEYWVIGTLPGILDVSSPWPAAADIDHILEHASSVLSWPSLADIIGVWYHPLLPAKLQAGCRGRLHEGLP